MTSVGGGRLKIAVIGAGSTYTPELVEGLIERSGQVPLRELALVDINAERLHPGGHGAAHVRGG